MPWELPDLCFAGDTIRVLLCRGNFLIFVLPEILSGFYFAGELPDLAFFGELPDLTSALVNFP